MCLMEESQICSDIKHLEPFEGTRWVSNIPACRAEVLSVLRSKLVYM